MYAFQPIPLKINAYSLGKSYIIRLTMITRGIINLGLTKGKNMSRIRLNNEKRDKLFKVARNFRMNDTTDVKLEKMRQAKEDCDNDLPKFFEIAKGIVQRAYPIEHCDTLKYFKNLYGSPCDVVAKDSCFYFAYTAKDQVDENGKPITNQKHFDFKLNGSLNGSEYNRDTDFAYAYYRDELMANDCNADIQIEQSDNQNNPHLTKHVDKCDKFLGFSNHSEDNISLARDWQEKYQVDVIGTSYCRSRSIACTYDEFQSMEKMLICKSNLVEAHRQFVKGVIADMNDVKGVLKEMKYLEGGVEFVNEFAQSNICDEAQIVRSEGMGLTIYNPQNALERIMARRKAQPTREEKIAIALKMHQDNALN